MAARKPAKGTANYKLTLNTETSNISSQGALPSEVALAIYKMTCSGKMPDEDRVLALEAENKRLQRELLVALETSKTLSQLRECLGYVENASEQVVAIYQDDATRTFTVKCGGVRDYYGDTFSAAIAAAHAEEKQGG